MKKNILSLAALAIMMLPSDMQAQNFDDYFVDKTLRIDYTFDRPQLQGTVQPDSQEQELCRTDRHHQQEG